MQKNVERIFGEWQALTGVLAGSAMSEDIVSATKLTIIENAYSVNLAGTIDRGSCHLQIEANPIKIKMEGENGPNAGRTFFAILEFLNVDEIRIAYDLSGTDYPSSFVPVPEEFNYVATFERC